MESIQIRPLRKWTNQHNPKAGNSYYLTHHHDFELQRIPTGWVVCPGRWVYEEVEQTGIYHAQFDLLREAVAALETTLDTLPGYEVV